ncbi:LysR substrate-binding domain-containing protein [Salinisphaera sp. SPP-AMP-43]|uniref:LysR family transcriptional regulator n=1 Tax=Salinisphaera sp. SPP-AMP-43 TaxID=3121288 RepID=UPI003C6E0C97
MRTPVLDLKALQSFVAIVETGSFTAAAQRMSYSQSAISMQLQRLEDALGVALLARTSRHLQPTRAGRETLGYAREMLRLSSELQQRLSHSEIAGKVRLGLPADFALYMPGTLAQFAERHPQVELEVRSEFSVTLVEQVAAGDIDMAIVTRESKETGADLLRREPLVWVTAPGSRAHLRDPLPLATWPRDICSFRAAATAALDATEHPWRSAYESQAFGALRATVLAGLAVTIAIPTMVDPELQILEPDEAGLPALPSIDIRLYRGSGRATQAADSLAELIVERIRN